MTIHSMCSLELSVHGLVIHMDTVVVDLNCQAILGMDILGDATKLPYHLGFSGWEIVRRWIRNHPTSPAPRGHGMFCGNGRHRLHPTTLRSDAVGKTEN